MSQLTLKDKIVLLTTIDLFYLFKQQILVILCESLAFEIRSYAFALNVFTQELSTDAKEPLFGEVLFHFR